MTTADRAGASLFIRDWHRVTSPEATRMLLQPRDARFFMPFLGRGRTLSEAAELLGVRRDTMLYRVRQLLALGLIEVTSVERGRGRPVKRYRSVSDGFVVGFAASQASSVLEVFLTRDAAQRELLGRGLLSAVVGEGGWHLRIYNDGNTLHWDAAPDDDPAWQKERLLAPTSPTAWYTNDQLRLGQDDAKALQHELAALLLRYREKHRPDLEQVHTLQLGLAPVRAPAQDEQWGKNTGTTGS